MNITPHQEQRIHSQLQNIADELFPEFIASILITVKTLDPEMYIKYQESIFHGHYPNQFFNPEDFNHTQEANALIGNDLILHLFQGMADSLGIYISEEDLEQ